MLAIQKRYKSLRALSAGSLAFAIGLSGAAAYIGSNLVHQNLTFNKQQTTDPRTDTIPAAETGVVTIDSTDQQGAVLYEQPQPTSVQPVVTTAPSAPIATPPTVPTSDTSTSPTSTVSNTQPTTTAQEPANDPSCTTIVPIGSILPIVTCP